MKRLAIPIILLSVFALGIGATKLWDFFFAPNHIKPNTTLIYKDKRYVPPDTIPGAKETPPETTITYLKPSPALRKEVEKSPEIPINTYYSSGELRFTVIDTTGIVKQKLFEFHPADIKSIEIDRTGTVKIKERTKMGKFIRRAGKWVAIGAAVVGGFIIGRALR